MTSLTGKFTLPIPPEPAFHYFTPLGERQWVPGWDPVFPDPMHDKVFQTDLGHPTTWVIVDEAAGSRIRYARVAHGLTAGTVEVNLAAQGKGVSEVTVTYALTPLSDKGREHLEAFARGYPDYLVSWQTAITSILAP